MTDAATPTLTTIITVRHAPSSFGADHRIAGTIDVPLSAHGERVAQAARAEVADLSYDVVVSSPLRRALDTARIMTGDGAIETRSDCMERDYGAMQGLPPAEVARLDPPVTYVAGGAFEHSVNPPGGETFPQLRRRARRFLDGLLRDHGSRSVLVFSHQTFLQQLHGELLGIDDHRCLSLDIHHVEMNAFTLDEKRRLVRYARHRPFADEDASW